MRTTEFRAAQKTLRAAGFKLQRGSESGSLYYGRKIDGLGYRTVRLSDHGVPQTAARVSEGSRWADNRHSVVLAADESGAYAVARVIEEWAGYEPEIASVVDPIVA